MKKTEVAKGWGMRVGGPRPYLASAVHPHKNEIEEIMSESYHRPVRVVVIPEGEWRRLKRTAQEGGGGE